MAEHKITPTNTEKDVALIQVTFKDNSGLLQIMRNLFFGLEMTADEKKTIVEAFKSDELKKLIHKRFNPTMSKDTLVGQTIDLWTGIDLVGKSPLEIQQTIAIRGNMIAMTRRALALLENPDGEKVVLDYGRTLSDELGIELTSRNRFIGHVEFQCSMLEVAANAKVETPEQTAKKVAKDSTR